MRIKLITILTFVVLLFTSCYNDSKNATVRINLGNMPIAKQVEKKSLIDKVFSVFVKDAFAVDLNNDMGVIKLHLAAYNGDILLSQESLDTTGMDTDNNVVDFTVSAKDNVTILVVGEYDNGDGGIYARYYGYNPESINLKAGETKQINITMNYIPQWNITDSTKIISFDCSEGICRWDSADIKVKYVLDYSSDGGSTYINVYSGDKTEFSIQDITGFYRFRIEFEPFKLKNYEFIYNYTMSECI